MPFDWRESKKDKVGRENNSKYNQRRRIETQKEMTERLLRETKEQNKKRDKKSNEGKK